VISLGSNQAPPNVWAKINPSQGPWVAGGGA